MKFITAYIISITITSGLAAQGNWQLESDSANFAFLVVDYETYEFEGGFFEIYEPCDTCSGNKIPFDITYKSPGDFGSILFQYDFAKDTIFYAGIVWNGNGDIIVPDKLMPVDSFVVEDSPAVDPVEFEYYNGMPGLLNEEEYFMKADSAWGAVSNLDIVHSFSESGYIAGFYLYPPSVGVFDPSVAKWVIFLYANNIVSDVEREITGEKNFQLYQNYPNPFNPATTIEFYLQKPSQVKVVLYDALGKEIKTLIAGFKTSGKHQLTFNAEGLSSGIYYYKIINGNRSETKKLVLLK